MDSNSGFAVGDRVRIIGELYNAKVCYVDEMKKCCGRVATITRIASDQAIGVWKGLELFKIDLDGGEWVWIPEWFIPLDDSFEPASEDELINMIFG